MHQIDWSGLVTAVIGLLVAITAAITIWNNRQLAAVRAEQKEVAENLSQVTADGKELRQYLQKNAGKGSIQ
jgi:hypothetical protein